MDFIPVSNAGKVLVGPISRLSNAILQLQGPGVFPVSGQYAHPTFLQSPSYSSRKPGNTRSQILSSASQVKL